MAALSSPTMRGRPAAILLAAFLLLGVSPGEAVGFFHRMFSPLRHSASARGYSSVRSKFSSLDLPKPPVWPDRFQLNFTEDNFFFLFTLSTSGTYFYDFASQRQRIDRANGLGDRYCGSAMPGYNTPCTHLVIDGMRYLYFLKEKYCCKCCDSESGCGVLRPDWLGSGNATYMGHDYIFGLLTTKWGISGLQQNYYWQTLDNIPVRIYQEPVTQMTFAHDTFSTPAGFDDTLFELPPILDCSPQCYGVCSVAQSKV